MEFFQLDTDLEKYSQSQSNKIWIRINLTHLHALLP